MHQQHHTVSTLEGSSGAPLLQLENGEMKVIGMHHGAIFGSRPLNQASTITKIIKTLHKLLLDITLSVSVQTRSNGVKTEGLKIPVGTLLHLNN